MATFIMIWIYLEVVIVVAAVVADVLNAYHVPGTDLSAFQQAV